MKQLQLAVLCALAGHVLTGCQPCGDGTNTIEIFNADDLDAIAQCEKIQAQVFVQGSELETFELPALKEIDGALLFNGNPKLRSVKLDALEIANHVGIPNAQRSGIHFQENPALSEVSFASLATVGSPSIAAGLSISTSSMGGTTLNVPKLARVFGELSLFRTAIAELTLPGITELQDLAIKENTALTAVRLPALKKVNNQVLISANALLTTLGFESLRTIGTPTLGGFELHENASIASLSLPALEVSGLGLSVRGNATLASVEVGGVAELIPVLAVRENAALRSLSLAHLSEVSTLQVIQNDALETITFTALRKAANLELAENRKLPTCQVKALIEQLESRDGVKSPINANNLADSCG